MGTLTTITAPVDQPITIQDARDACRLIDTDNDSILLGMMETAIDWAEKYTNKRLMTQIVELSFRRFTAYSYSLGVWPIQSVDSIKYTDTGSPQTVQTLVSGTDYLTDLTVYGGRVEAISGWPSVADIPNACKIRMTVGYSSADNVPKLFKNGIKAYIAYLFNADEVYKKIAEDILRPERIPLESI